MQHVSLREITVNFRIGKKRALLQIDAIGAVVCLVGSLAVFFAVLGPLIKQRSFLANQRDELAARRDESSGLGASMRMLGNQLATVERELAQSKIRLGSSDRANQRLAALTELFYDCSLAVDDIQAQKTSAGPTWDLVPIGIAGRGEYMQCVAALGRLRQRFADMSVARFRLTGDPARSEEPEAFRFQLLWHTAPQAKAVRN